MLYPNGSKTRPNISSPYGPRSGGLTSFHEGADLIGFSDAKAAAAGRVTFAGWLNSAAGNTVTIHHGGEVYTRYMHLASLTVRDGQDVGEGQTIGRVGRTGNATGDCLHFEVRTGAGFSRTDPIAYVAGRLTSDVPAFPLPGGSYFGPKSGPAESVSGYYSHRDDLRRWQQRMHDRGWQITPDGLYGDQTGDVAEAFQREKGLTPDRKIGPQTWAAAWTAPVT